MRKYHLQISLVKESNFIDRKFDLTIYVSVLNHVRSILAVVYVCMCTIQIQKQTHTQLTRTLIATFFKSRKYHYFLKAINKEDKG